ncbi:MAG: hypothetical protein R2789_05525 [Microthrixaceae bacterium]
MLNTTPAPGDGTGPTGPPVVVWDLGNVLIPWERTGALLAVGDPDEAERLAEEVFTLEVNALLDAVPPCERCSQWWNGTIPAPAGRSRRTSSTSGTASDR